MDITGSDTPTVTLIVVPRERFSCTQAALESIYQNTPSPFDLVYVDGGSPDDVRRYLEQESAARGFRLIRTPEYLTPNQARNLGLRHAGGRYVVFIDNDVQVAPGWLAALIGCAEDTGAGVVGPLYFIGEPEDQKLHMAGGELWTEEPGGLRIMRERHRFANRSYAEVRDEIERGECAFVEFHCLLARKSLLDELGPFDEELCSVLEHIDFCLRARGAGYSVWLEPRAHVCYLAGRPFILSDLPYFKRRWGDEWNERSLRRFAAAWSLDNACPLLTETRGWLSEHQSRLRLPAPPATTVAGRAQTNIQLYNQCIASGYAPEELALLRAAYEQAQVWFGHLYRGCGRPFLAHLAGTASLLASCGAHSTLVLAGLLHSVYEFGAVNGFGPGITEAKRQHVAQRIHPGVERWLYEYASFDWQRADVAALGRDLDRMPLTTAKVLLLRLANDLEERLDHSILFCAKPNDTLERWLPLFTAVAERLGVPQLAQELALTRQRNAGFIAPAALRSAQHGTYELRDGQAVPATQRRIRPARNA